MTVNIKSYVPAVPSKHCCSVLLSEIIADEVWFPDVRLAADWPTFDWDIASFDAET